jgi:ABC-type multidrug transport system ATPase subunit
MKLVWRDIGFTVKDEAQATKHILNNVSGEALPEQFVAILGPSGSGKTSLLTLLAGRTPQGSSLSQAVTGTITFDGVPRSNQTKRKTGFVLQDDAFFANLTVRETLSIQGSLRAATNETVEQTLSEMGLLKCADTIVGGFAAKGISGGERKRLSIAMELVGQPKLLLLDEPTSGLDSTAAHSVMFRLRLLANTGTTLVCSIHQPSSQVFIINISVARFLAGLKSTKPLILVNGTESIRRYNPWTHTDTSDTLSWQEVHGKNKLN